MGLHDCVRCGREDSETINGCDLCFECGTMEDEKIDETLWASIGYRLGQLLGEGIGAGDLTEASAAPALLGLKAGLRDYGTLGATELLEQIERWTVQDIMRIREEVTPPLRTAQKVCAACGKPIPPDANVCGDALCVEAWESVTRCKQCGENWDACGCSRDDPRKESEVKS